MTQAIPESANSEERWAFFLRGLETLESMSTEMDSDALGTFCQAWVSPGDVRWLH